MLLSARLHSKDLPMKFNGVLSSSCLVSSRGMQAESLVRKHSCCSFSPPINMTCSWSMTQSWSPTKIWLSTKLCLRPSSLSWLFVCCCGKAVLTLVVISCDFFIKLKVSKILKLRSLEACSSRMLLGSAGSSSASWIFLVNLCVLSLLIAFCWPFCFGGFALGKAVCCPIAVLFLGGLCCLCPKDKLFAPPVSSTSLSKLTSCPLASGTKLLSSKLPIMQGFNPSSAGQATR